ncbi:uncharacterized protein [Dysidea avara]|uniref:uncharacterized protein isoform X2 n=1 Tax=Dysidea avara TaxID=196820 RepID=UPI0033277B9F
MEAEMDIDSNTCSMHGDGETSATEHEFEQDDEVRSCKLYASKNDRERSAALLLLTVKERFKLTQSAVDFITQQVHHIISYGVDDIQEVVQEWLESQGIVMENFAELSARLEPLRNPFASFETEYLQSKFYRDHFNLVEPLRITLGDGTNNDSFEYVPLLKSLKALLDHPEICDEIVKDNCRTDGLIGDYCYASFIRNDPYFQDNENALQLLLYFDEVEVCDALASHRGEHKLGLFYYTIANLRPELRSTHRSIQLVAVVKSSLLANYGFSEALKPFIDDVTKLYNDGLFVSFNGSETLFCGTVVAFLADTWLPMI